jgi:murein DD-endopeptidase MepM/ murein hydrolase activator NlpD
MDSELTLYPGKVIFKKFSTNLKDGKYHFTCGKRKIPFSVSEKTGVAYFMEGYFSRLNSERCSFKGEEIFVLTKKAFPYKSEKLNVAKRKVFYNKEDLARIIKEKEIKKKIYLNSAKNFLFDEEFRVPLNSYITSHYGNKRLFNNKKKSQHLGNDLRAAVGVKIPVMNRGRVVFTGDLFFSGKVVVVDHGLEIFSLYGHLSKILVQKGDVVNKGDIVGLAGATGRVSGPHLHWGVKIQGQWVDGFSLVSESQKHFSQDEK